MITYIYIDGFKSFQNFEMYFSPYTIIAGANASGKSNLFDALAILSELAGGMTAQQAFHNSRGEQDELFTIFNDGSQSEYITFKVDVLVDTHLVDEWGQNVNLEFTRFRYEIQFRRVDNLLGSQVEIIKETLSSISKKDDEWANKYKIKNWENWHPKTNKRRIRPYIYTSSNENNKSIIIQDGDNSSKSISIDGLQRSILSKYDSIETPHIYAVRKEMVQWHFLQLTPNDLRMPSEIVNKGTLSPTGKNLAGTLFQLKKKDPYNLIAISRLVGKFLPNFVSADVVQDEEGKRLILMITDREGRSFSSRVLSEGTLRILALCVLAVDDSFSGVLCFEEPENGIHPFRIASMAELLNKFSTQFLDTETSLHQIIINTHSPLFVMLAKNLNNRFIQSFLSRTVTYITNNNGKRVKMEATKMIPIVHNNAFPQLSISDNELRMAAMTEQEFLNIMGQPNKEERF